MDSQEFFEEEEGAEAPAEEGANRTFIILVGAFGGILALGICAFVVWAFVIAPRMREGRDLQNQAILATNTAVAAAMVAAAETETAAVQPTPTETMAPTDTPRPTATTAPTATPAPETPAPEALTATAEEIAEAATATPFPSPTRRPTATPRPSGEEGVPETGIGTLGAGGLALGLLVLLIVVRRLRRAV